MGDVTLNGEGKNYFFKINKDSSLILNNIKFINSYTDSYSQLGAINNQGKLLVNTSSFNNMNSLMSTFYNEGELIIDNTIISNSKSKKIAWVHIDLKDYPWPIDSGIFRNIDEEKTANIILNDFRNGKLGKITLEKVNEK